jgi:hypothetical protein
MQTYELPDVKLWNSTYIYTLDSVAHHISSLEEMPRGKDVVEHQWCTVYVL